MKGAEIPSLVTNCHDDSALSTSLEIIRSTMYDVAVLKVLIKELADWKSEI